MSIDAIVRKSKKIDEKSYCPACLGYTIHLFSDESPTIQKIIDAIEHIRGKEVECPHLSRYLGDVVRDLYGLSKLKPSGRIGWVKVIINCGGSFPEHLISIAIFKDGEYQGTIEHRLQSVCVGEAILPSVEKRLYGCPLSEEEREEFSPKDEEEVKEFLNKFYRKVSPKAG